VSYIVSEEGVTIGKKKIVERSTHAMRHHTHEYC